MSDLISRQAVLRLIRNAVPEEEAVTAWALQQGVKQLPSVQPEPSTERQEILEYLDTVLHPIISPEHWDVYSELHDMISSLPSAQPRIKGKWNWCGNHHLCSECDEWALTRWDEDGCDEMDILTDFCPNCGADMREEDE